MDVENLNLETVREELAKLEAAQKLSKEDKTIKHYLKQIEKQLLIKAALEKKIADRKKEIEARDKEIEYLTKQVDGVRNEILLAKNRNCSPMELRILTDRLMQMSANLEIERLKLNE